jgi:hypothetical protein
LIPVILTIVSDEDISNLEKGMKIPIHRQRVIARITQEAYTQGALLSMRDIGLLFSTHPTNISRLRKLYESENKTSLPHTGSLQDVGTCITHKYQILYKYVVEKKDSLTVARETNHSQRAVDKYLKDFNRVKILYLEHKTPEFINITTGMSLFVIKQYLDIINQYIKEQNVS